MRCVAVCPGFLNSDVVTSRRFWVKSDEQDDSSGDEVDAVEADVTVGHIKVKHLLF